MDTGVLICATILIIFISYFVYARQSIRLEGFDTQKSRVPKIIWSYWSDEKLPPIIELCVKSWKKYNPNYQIIMMHKSNYKQYVKSLPDEIANHPNFNNPKVPQHFADLLRIYCIAENAGCWCDASILMYESLDNILPQNFDYELFAYFLRPKLSFAPIIENWFFAAPPNSEFIRRWRDEFTRVKDFSSPYMYSLNLIFREGVLPNMGNPIDIRGYGYLAMHFAAQKILQKDKYPLDKLVLHDAVNGPFKYSQWWGTKIFARDNMEYACKNPSVRYPMMKMTRTHRPAFLEFMDREECKWV